MISGSTAAYNKPKDQEKSYEFDKKIKKKLNIDWKN